MLKDIIEISEIAGEIIRDGFGKNFQIEYKTEHAAPKVKSVQLPAHTVNANQTVAIVADKTSVTDTLYAQLTEALNEKQLKWPSRLHIVYPPA